VSVRRNSLHNDSSMMMMMMISIAYYYRVFALVPSAPPLSFCRTFANDSAVRGCVPVASVHRSFSTSRCFHVVAVVACVSTLAHTRTQNHYYHVHPSPSPSPTKPSNHHHYYNTITTSNRLRRRRPIVPRPSYSRPPSPTEIMKILSVASLLVLATSASAFVPSVAPLRTWCVVVVVVE
jgi:hypothetical protein